ncbi:MAG TPA: VWA domain-containing protein [Polyangiaceae bacterium]|nr:VWA domain-containing protein [Polyangiaceae bacterium]
MLASQNGDEETTPRAAPGGLRRSLLRLLALVGTGLVLAYCGGGDDDDGGGPGFNCANAYGDRCGSSCVSDATCGAGLFCSSGACTAQCSGDQGCSGGQSCSAQGRCVGGGTGGSGTGGSGTGGSGIGVSGSGGSGDGGQGGQCAGVKVQFMPVIPSVVILVDQSGSMTDGFDDNNPATDPNPSRWVALRSNLLDPVNGIIKKLETKVRFGLATYSWDRKATCPQLPVNIEPKLNNYDVIKASYEKANPLDNTPTAESVKAVHDQLTDPGFQEPGPKVIILATDGNPDTCDDPDSNGEEGPRTGSVNAVKAAFGDGIRTFALGIDFLEEPNGEQHLQDLAAAGQGIDPVPPLSQKLYFNAEDQAQLQTAFDSIINEVARVCVFDLDANITPEAAPRGTVTVDGEPIALDPTNGWKLNDSNTIEFVGAACDKVKAGATDVLASFPCGTGGVTPIPR